MSDLERRPIPLCTIGLHSQGTIRAGRHAAASEDLRTFAQAMRLKIPAETRAFLHWWCVAGRLAAGALTYGEEILAEGLKRGREMQANVHRSPVILGWEIENVFQELIYQRRNATVADKQHFPVQVESFYLEAKQETVFLLAFRFIDRCGHAVYAVPTPRD